MPILPIRVHRARPPEKNPHHVHRVHPNSATTETAPGGRHIGLYKIFVWFEAFVQESILLFANTPLARAPYPPLSSSTLLRNLVFLPHQSFIAIHAIQY